MIKRQARRWLYLIYVTFMWFNINIFDNFVWCDKNILKIVDIESNLSGYKEFEGQIIASGNESIAFNYGNPFNMFFMSPGNDQYPNTIMLTDFNIFDAIFLDF